MELKQAVGKTVERLEIVEDFNQRDIDITFTDGTFLHIGINPTVEVKARFEKAEVLRTA
jgi:hypothetical protein